MGMKQYPDVIAIEKNVNYWTHTFERFRVKTFVPAGNPLAEIVNFGFKAPYLLVFEEKELSPEDALDFAKERGFLELARSFDTSVVFVYPTAEGGWDDADEQLFIDLVAESRTQQYHENGIIRDRAFFSGEWKDYYIRGAIFRTCLYGYGKSADYIAASLLKTLHGQYLWGPGEITILGAVLERLSITPVPERRDIPIISVNNSEEINAALRRSCDHFRIGRGNCCIRDYYELLGRYKRWCGVLEEEPCMEIYGMTEEAFAVTVRTSPDNLGDDAGTEKHEIGCLAYYRNGLFEKGPVPLLVVFHGGGDSTFYITHVSGWWRVAMRHGFLLVAVENHLNSTAAEAIELINRLKEKYPIDEHRIYASGFSMGGIKTWDLYQEYPKVFAGLAPMSATFGVGANVYGNPSPKEINRSEPVPLFYAGGEITPLPELPFQSEKCLERMKYVLEVNQAVTQNPVSYDGRDSWKNPIWGIDGDRTEVFYDPDRKSNLTVQYFESGDGVTRTAFASISGQGHECREHTCEHAWQFLSRFTR